MPLSKFIHDLTKPGRTRIPTIILVLWIAGTIDFLRRTRLYFPVFMFHFLILHLLLWGRNAYADKRMRVLETILNAAEVEIPEIDPVDGIKPLRLPRTVLNFGPLIQRLAMLEADQSTQVNTTTERLTKHDKALRSLDKHVNDITEKMNTEYDKIVLDRENEEELSAHVNAVGKSILDPEAWQVATQFMEFAQQRGYKNWGSAVAAVLNAVMMQQKTDREGNGGDGRRASAGGDKNLQLTRVGN